MKIKKMAKLVACASILSMTTSSVFIENAIFAMCVNTRSALKINSTNERMSLLRRIDDQHRNEGEGIGCTILEFGAITGLTIPPENALYSGCLTLTDQYCNAVTFMPWIHTLRLVNCILPDEYIDNLCLPALKKLSLSNCRGIICFCGVESFSALQELKVSRYKKDVPFQYFRAIESLESLFIKDCQQLSSLRALDGYPRLQKLQISWERLPEQFSGLPVLNELEYLHLEVCPIFSLLGSPLYPRLLTVEFYDCVKLVSLDGVSTCFPNMKNITLDGCSKLQWK
ncbi:MAG: hypothetical protein LBB21_07030 [Holosporaceae bacterium]|jgi:hypothetical protein|nr:hypothetical protein [Holosporaceae bacterium]